MDNKKVVKKKVIEMSNKELIKRVIELGKKLEDIEVKLSKELRSNVECFNNHKTLIDNLEDDLYYKVDDLESKISNLEDSNNSNNNNDNITKVIELKDVIKKDELKTRFIINLLENG